jgi:uncharacterized membrane protein
MAKYMDDLLVLLGAGLITTGFYFVMPVLALFSAGIFLIVFGLIFGFGQSGQQDRYKE